MVASLGREWHGPFGDSGREGGLDEVRIQSDFQQDGQTIAFSLGGLLIA
jgi:hypothetical protein